MRKLNYQGWEDLYDDIHNFAKGRLPVKKLDDICWIIEESKISIFKNKNLKESKKIFICVMYVYAANVLATRGEWCDGDGF